MSRIWFTSDTHFGHRNVITYSNRPWADVDAMNEGLIANWNERVKPGDAVYHLGDFTLTTRVELIDSWLGRLNGEIRLIRGNHDNWLNRLDRIQNGGRIKWVKDYVERTFEVGGIKRKIVMCHFPLMFWHQSHHGSFHLHGHCHGNANHHNTNVRRLDVGVDPNGWKPLSLEEIVQKLENVPLNPHHDRFDD